MAEGVGHYGIFNGRRWRDVIAPVVEEFIRAHSVTTAKAPAVDLPAPSAKAGELDAVAHA
jgi:poly(3-hydroxybutyrate) depolymerase